MLYLFSLNQPKMSFIVTLFIVYDKENCYNGEIVPCIFESLLNGDIFNEYIAKFLAPTLNSGDIVVMDNLSSKVSLRQ